MTRDQESEQGQGRNKDSKLSQQDLVTDRSTLDHANMDAFNLSTLRINKIFTLVFIHDKEKQQLLLGQKQRGPLVGQWNGFGGKVEKGMETIADSAARELLEEAFIEAPLFPIGHIQWVVSPEEEGDGTQVYRDVMIVYKAHSISRHLDQTGTGPVTEARFRASDEMAPAWWPVDGLPWDKMRINHHVWYPFLLAGQPYRGVYWYKETMAHVTAANAQRESAKAIWIEDLAQRRVQYGDACEEVEEEDKGKDVQGYARMLGSAASMVEIPEAGHPSYDSRLDRAWLLKAIAKDEQDWV